MAYDSDARRASLRRFLKAHGLKEQPLEIASGVGQGTIRAFLKGRTKTLTDNTYEKLAQGASKLIEANVPSAELRGETQTTAQDSARQRQAALDERPSADPPSFDDEKDADTFRLYSDRLISAVHRIGETLILLQMGQRDDKTRRTLASSLRDLAEVIQPFETWAAERGVHRAPGAASTNIEKGVRHHLAGIEQLVKILAKTLQQDAGDDREQSPRSDNK